MPLLDIRNLAVSIGGTSIIDGVSLSIEAGEVYGLLGPNGAGKSTTIAAALGLLPLVGGDVTVLGRDPHRNGVEVRRDVGVLPEQNGFYDWMRANDYLRFFDRLYGRASTGEQIAAALSRVGLDAAAGQKIVTFSRGMRQRLGLARALLGSPRLLFLDEPTNGLDPRGRREIHDILLRMSREDKVGILLCSHLLDDVERLCTRIGFIVDGRTVAQGNMAAMLDLPQANARFRLRLANDRPLDLRGLEFVRLIEHKADRAVVDLDPQCAPEAAWRGLLRLRWPIVEIARDNGSLEDLYLDLTERKAA